MSLSDGNDASALTGRVILGPGAGPASETTILEMESRRSPMHFEEVEAQFWERVRAKAKAKASAIIADAMAEAEQLKAKALEDGYAQGVASAGEQVQNDLAQMAASLGSMLESLTAERRKLWDAHRQDFVTLLRRAVEQTIAVSIDSRRQEILQNLLTEAIDLMDAKDSLVVTVHPDDEPLMRELLTRAQQERPALSQVLTKVNDQLLPGSVALECPDGLVDNTVANRFAEVEAIFTHLTEAGDPDAPS